MSAALPFDAVLFDCDGVLVDSEPITHRVLSQMLNEEGWPITHEECMQIFVGKAVKDEAALIAQKTGKPLSTEWLQGFWARRNEALTRDLLAIPGAVAGVRAVHAAFEGRIACASGADRKKVELQLHKVGLYDAFEGRIFSGHETPRSKPWPDVYLQAAEALGAEPSRCAVVEDSATGALAGLRAGAAVLGYCPGGVGHSSAQAMRAVGVHHLFSDMAQLPQALWAAAQRF